MINYIIRYVTGSKSGSTRAAQLNPQGDDPAHGQSQPQVLSDSQEGRLQWNWPVGGVEVEQIPGGHGLWMCVGPRVGG